MKRRVLIGVVILAAVQIVMIAAYREVSLRRGGRRAVGAFTVERVGEALDAKALVLERQDGTLWNLGELRGRPIVLHFWATWCRPCRDELPTLLVQGSRVRRAGAELALVSVDDDWAEIRRFFGGAVPPEVSRVASADYRRMTTGRLPETLIIGRSGVVATRVRGARDWRSAPATALLDSVERADE